MVPDLSDRLWSGASQRGPARGKATDMMPARVRALARLIHEPAALGRAGFDVSVAA
jgi:hypothetical protein